MNIDMSTPTTFVFVLVEDFSHLAFSCAVEPLRIANLVAGHELYRWELASSNGQTVRCSNGVVTLVDRGLTPAPRGSQVIVVSGINVQNHVDVKLLRYLRAERVRGTAIGAVCSGALILAEAGFLDDRKAAIHWEYHDLFAERYPEVRLTKSVFVTDEKFVTSSGGAAVADMMLHLIAGDHGGELAALIAEQMVYNAVREADATQRVSVRSRYGTANEKLVRAIHFIEENIEAPLSNSNVAKRLGISARQLERLFERYLKTTPRRYILEARLQRARNLLMQSEEGVTEIAIACGFLSPSRFSKLYRVRYGTSPAKQRATLYQTRGQRA
ncbi:GlxA family transcriptional regulator [Sinorhizobium meliloti]|nr:GlxA family transcriptional regulator [Sinorhizobium meliloti]